MNFETISLATDMWYVDGNARVMRARLSKRDYLKKKRLNSLHFHNSSSWAGGWGGGMLERSRSVRFGRKVVYDMNCVTMH